MTVTWNTLGPIYGGLPISLDEFAAVNNYLLLYSRTHPQNTTDFDNVILSNDSGQHWQHRITNIHSDYTISKPLFSASSNQFIAAGVGTKIKNPAQAVVLTSPNGFDWQQVYAVPNLIPLKVHATDERTVIMCEHSLLISNDLTTWTEVKLPEVIGHHYISDVQVFKGHIVAVSSDSVQTSFINVDLNDYSIKYTLAPSNDFHTLAASPDQLMLIGDTNVVYSNDGVSWSNLWNILIQYTWPKGQRLNDVVYHNGQWVLAWTMYNTEIVDGTHLLMAQNSGLLRTDTDQLNAAAKYTSEPLELKEASKVYSYNGILYAINTVEQTPENYILGEQHL